MQRYKRDGCVSAVGFGLLAAACFAAQHPLEKPLLSTIPNRGDAVAVAVIAGELVGAIILVYLLVTNKLMRHQVRSIVFDRRHWLKLIGLALLSSISLVTYLFVLRYYNAVTVAIFANLFPLWVIIIAGLLPWGARPDRATVAILAAVALAIVFVDANAVDLSFMEASKKFVALSLVPIAFSLSHLLQDRFFEGVNPLVYVAVLSAVDAPLFIGLALIYRTAAGASDWTVLSAVGPSLYVSFVIGAALSGYFASYLLQKAIRAYDPSKGYATVSFFLIPAIAGGYAWLLTVAGIDGDNQFNQTNIWTYVIFTIGFIAFFVIGRIGHGTTSRE